jgi:preprotein translocase subunit SecE
MSRSIGDTIWVSRHVARTSPLEFIQQVRAETRKVAWPTRRETVMTAVMVMIMTVILAVFFFGIDTGFEAIVKFLLSLATK